MYFFRLYVRVISIVVLAFFSWISIQPWNYAVWAQSSPKSQSVSSRSAKSASGGFEKNLRKIQKLINKLDDEAGSGKDITLTLDSLKGHRQALQSADQDIRAEFSATGKFLKDKKLPALILDRHAKAVADYEANYKKLKGNLDGILLLEGERKQAKVKGRHAEVKDKMDKIKLKVKDAKDHLKDKVKKSKRQTTKPDKLPNRSRKLKGTKTSWLKHVGDFLFPSVYAAEADPTPDIVELADQLGGTPVDLYEFVRNNFKYEPYIGSVKGASLTLAERAGNEWDQASLLIALLRASGYQARYAVGSVEIPIDKAMSWLGVEDANMAASLLMTQGRPTTIRLSGGGIGTLRTRQVWVQAYVPFLHSRGASTGPGDTWVDLDPSFKTQKATQTLDMSGVPVFDQTGYLSTFRTESALDFYKAQLQSFIGTGYVPEALARNTEIEPEYLGILVGQLPYTMLSVDATYTDIPDSLRQKFTILIQDPYTGENQLSYTASMPSILGKRLTISYAPASATDEQTIASYGSIYDTPPYLINLVPEVKLEGVRVAQGKPVGSGQDQTMRFVFNSVLFTEQVENTIITGEYYGIGLSTPTFTQEQAYKESWILMNVNETLDLADFSNLDDRLGELLYLSAMIYHQTLGASIRQATPTSQVVDIREVSEMMYFLTVQVDEVFGVPKSLTAIGFTGDLDRDTHLVIPVDGNLDRTKPFMQLIGNQSSYLEHDITESIYDSEAISAVKALQLASDQGIPIHTVTKGNIFDVLSLLQLSEEVKTDILNAVNMGQNVIVPEYNLNYVDWTGVGYIIQNPSNGEGAYRISGGQGGVATVFFGVLGLILNRLLSSTGTNAYAATISGNICYPGTDNIYGTDKDICFTSAPIDAVTFIGPCDPNDSANPCRTRYGRSNPGAIIAPLIFIKGSERVKLTAHISVGEWASKDGSEYMRAGGIVITAEGLVDFMAPSNAKYLAIDSGYRSKEYNLSDTLKEKGASPTSYHPNGLAIDVRVLDSDRKNLPQCQVLGSLAVLVEILGQGAEVKDEGKANTAHAARPVPWSFDEWTCD